MLGAGGMQRPPLDRRASPISRAAGHFKSARQAPCQQARQTLARACPAARPQNPVRARLAQQQIESETVSPPNQLASGEHLEQGLRRRPKRRSAGSTGLPRACFRTHVRHGAHHHAFLSKRHGHGRRFRSIRVAPPGRLRLLLPDRSPSTLMDSGKRVTRMFGGLQIPVARFLFSCAGLQRFRDLPWRSWIAGLLPEVDRGSTQPGTSFHHQRARNFARLFDFVDLGRCGG